ncbi:D-amino-acid dehydrogenase [Agrobacterium larrymoorei]|uniref:D-amino-acid dehydrogenase n=1 Tax=Agrobacterium larrymoorei TaxID=160699 RepID=A0AAJ2EPR9_9HYPH|nr:FAD-binding oxidoreductase [Agrobacterium larrymoorei]MDR6100465.1 D-amino-acid dehydrogenase [Agrobacterium larrymoorei]
MQTNASPHVAILGGGIIGACSALALLKEGYRVTIVEPGKPGGGQAASYGNGAFISPASIIPMSMPGLWKKVPEYLLSPSSPLTIRWRFLPRLLPWLTRFILAGWSVGKVERTAGILNTLINDAPARHAALAAECGHGEFIRRDGLLYAYPTRADFEADALAWRLRRENGLVWRELENEELRAFEPALSPRYRFAALVEAGGHCTDPGGYVAMLLREAVERGASYVETKATGFRLDNNRVTAVKTEAGEIVCDRAVIAAGIHSKALAALAGDIIPLESERGYHVEIANPAAAPHIPVMPCDGKMANTLIAGRLRASGQVELANVNTEPNWARADILLKQLIATYPGLDNGGQPLVTTRWQGNRPSTPDGLPVVGAASASPDIVHAFGHGHIGLASGPRTATLVAALISGQTPPIDVTPFRATRFR